MAGLPYQPPEGMSPKGLDFPDWIDSSGRGAFATCPTKFFYGTMRHLQSLTPSVHLHAGGAFAKGMEITRDAFYADKKVSKVAIGLGMLAIIDFYGDYECPPDSAKSCENMLGAFDYYFVQWDLETDTLKPYMPKGKPAVEFSFALPIPGVNHPTTGDPMLYVGRFDMLGEMPGGALFVVDDKTTKALGPTWSQQWDLRAQFTGYCWAAREYGHDVQGAIIRGISILKRSNGHAQAITYRPQWKVDLWLDQLIHDVKTMISMWESGRWSLNLDASCTLYGGCPYKALCDVPNPEHWIAGNFEVRVWDPLA